MPRISRHLPVAECCERLAKCLREHGIGYLLLHVTDAGEVIREYQFAS